MLARAEQVKRRPLSIRNSRPKCLSSGPCPASRSNYRPRSHVLKPIPKECSQCVLCLWRFWRSEWFRQSRRCELRPTDQLPGLPAGLRRRRQHRLQIYVAASVQRVGLGPTGPMLHQSIFCECTRAHGLSAASPRLLRLTNRTYSRHASQTHRTTARGRQGLRP